MVVPYSTSLRGRARAPRFEVPCPLLLVVPAYGAIDAIGSGPSRCTPEGASSGPSCSTLQLYAVQNLNPGQDTREQTTKRAHNSLRLYSRRSRGPSCDLDASLVKGRGRSVERCVILKTKRNTERFFTVRQHHIRSFDRHLRPHAVLPWYPDRIASSRHAQRIRRTRWLATHCAPTPDGRAGRRAGGGRAPRPQAPRQGHRRRVGSGVAVGGACVSLLECEQLGYL